MKKLSIIFMVSLIISSNLIKAQVTTKPAQSTAKPIKAPVKPIALPTPTTSVARKDTLKYPGRAGFGLGINFSTNGPGIDLAKSFGKKGRLAVRLAGNYMAIGVKDYIFKLDQTELVINADIKLGSLGAIIDLHPFANAFKISAGYSVLLTEVKVTALTKDSTKQGDVMISPAEIGQIDAGITIKPSIYLGMGFGRAVPRKRVGFTFEVGAYFIKHPDLSFKVSGMLEPTSSQEKVLQDNLSGLSWLPVMNFGMNFRLGKL